MKISDDKKQCGCGFFYSFSRVDADLLLRINLKTPFSNLPELSGLSLIGCAIVSSVVSHIVSNKLLYLYAKLVQPFYVVLFCIIFMW